MTLSGAFPWRKPLGLAIVLLNGTLALLFLLAPSFTQPLAPEAIRPETGHNFVASFASRAAFPFGFTWDSSSDPEAAYAVVIESGRSLGPAHAAHADIRESGAGRFSFWSGALYFSTSDNSDPRTNGRSYEVRYETRPLASIVAAMLGLDLLALLVFGRTVARFTAANAEKIAAVLALAFAGRLMAAAAGLATPLFAEEASALDGPMIGAILLHLLVGLALTALIFASGAGMILWAARGQQALNDLLLRAFLPGLVVVAAAALAALCLPYGTILAVLICVAATLPLRSYRVDRNTLRQAAVPPLLCLPAVLLFATVLAFRFHGPSATLPGAPLGDTAIYAGIADILTQRVFPLFNFANEGFRLTYGNVLPSLLAAPLLGQAWFDPYLFFSASLAIVAALSLALLLPLLARLAHAAYGTRLAGADLLIFGGLLLGAFRYSSVMVESPSFVFVVPIIVCVVYLWSIPKAGTNRYWQALATAALGSAISKVVSFAVLVPLGLPELVRHTLRRASRRQLFGACAAGVLVLIYVAFALWTYLPGFIRLGRLGPSSWDTIVRYRTTAVVPVLCVLARDLGAVLLALAVTRCSLPGLTLGVWAGVLSFLVMPFLCHTNLTAVMLVTALAFVVRHRHFTGQRRMLLVAAGLLLPQTVISEPGGSSVSIAWLLAVSFMVWTAGRDPQAARQTAAAVARPRGTVFASLAAGLLLLVLWGAACGALNAGPQAFVFTPDVRDIWIAVRERTPKDSLIFTDQTGATESRTGGWNDFALAAQRQFFLVSWEVTPLRYDEALRRQWLDHNAAILAGAEHPRDLELSRSYSDFYAVVARERPAPPGATMIYANTSFALYRLQAGL